MKFKMNNDEWKIKEVAQKDFDKDDDEQDGYYYGRTKYATQEVWLWKDLKHEKKRRTLIHELTHIYISTYITNQSMDFNEEKLCDIAANSHDIIHNIVEKYFLE